ncbi:hypothetical protein HRW16_35500 [Streptomyces lunaelactis]|uniref:hypothetical protein n=3 Tax=Streptomyces lunaelactis TaxID=1535768 RepID=UPI0015855D82|nr:hypothetical protein [Streptomyces lunaelactis]NUK38203.1 hypothetical protein [Streptomyces lunaelactis]NUK97024.1 hypothetical protein [Streptomyces lunaelactis]NUL14942.1 hypothetical protein [Streptomyces lunaelactis]NUL34794.1 hypothetical protein [Streptomyces lunaelactis]
MTTTPALNTPPQLPAQDDPSAPSSRSVRFGAGIGLVLLLFAFALSVVLALGDAIQGDGSAGVLVNVGMWSLALSGFTGLGGVCIPQSAMTRAARAHILKVQYALLLLGPVLVGLD